jgi:hypothetical protein
MEPMEPMVHMTPQQIAGGIVTAPCTATVTSPPW